MRAGSRLFVEQFYTKIKATQSGGFDAMITTRTIGAALANFLAIVTLAAVAPLVHGQDDAREDLSPCPGSAPEPAQSSAWSVAFCNRTGHDIVIEFHDNDCPARNWDRRGDVYQRTLRRGESKTLPLCYANEPQTKKAARGVPTLRIPGGKGVVTTWNVVGDCGDRSKPLNLDARTFYDRGEYKTGIVLLQYPSGASHCVAESSNASTNAAGSTAAAAPSLTNATTGPAASGATASGTAAPAGASASPPAAGTSPTGQTQGRTTSPASSAQTQGAATSPPTQTQPPVQPAVATHSPIAAPPAVAAATNPRSGEAPTLSVAVDTKDVVGRTVRVFAKGGAGYRCNFNVALTFTDGASWNDRAKADITAGDADAPIATRKYLKSVTKAEITSSKCTPM
ncbi:MAG: hypothetical protein ACJ8R9_26000 [Steroidobacteraceae bacterium]